MIELGPSDNIALDQPRVAIELLVSTGPGADDWGSVGPSMFNTLLLDTGSNSVLAMATAVNDLSNPPYVYETQGTFLEAGVAGDHEMDISVPYRFDFAGTNGIRNTIDDARILSDPNIDFSMFGPWGLVGMPAMVDRVTSIDMSVWSASGSLEELYMRADFSSDVPENPGHRYSVPVDNRIQFDPVAQTTSGDPPVWGDVPFLTAIPTSNGLGLEGNFLFDTGAQMSVISEQMAFNIGLDANGNGTLDDEALRFETVGGVGGSVAAPVLFIDEVRVPTEGGVELVWTDLQWLALDIDLPGTDMTLDGVFGSDLLTSGWVEALFSGGPDGYFQQVHFDFRTMDDNGTGAILFDLSPAVDQVILPGPGVRTLETLGYTEVLEGGTEDDYRLVLTSQPTADVTIAFAPANGEISVEEEGVPGSLSLTFTSENWNVPQVIHVTATNDDAAEGPHTSRVTHIVTSADPGYDGIPARDIDVNILDDDLSLLTIEQTDGSTDVTEDGASDSFTVELADDPGSMEIWVLFEDTSGQTFAYAEGSDPYGGDPMYNVLTFSSGNWSAPQTVIIEANDDSIVEGPHQSYQILSVIDYATASVIGQTTLTVNIQDNDIGSVFISETADSTDVSEDGTVDTYTVVLGKLPTHDVQIDLENLAGQLAAVDNASPSNAFLLFSPSNWDTPQTVRVSAVDDDAAEGTHISEIEHSATSVDPGYDGLAIRDVRVRIEDNEAGGVVISETEGSTIVAEGGAADTYSIVLSSQPTHDVLLNLQTGDQIVAVDNANPANAFVVYTPNNWDVPQVIRVTAVDDQLVEDTLDVSVAHEALSTDANYRGTHNLTVQVTDNETAAAVVGRLVFYNNSAWDGNDAGANADDDNAIATDKQALLLPDQTAAFVNYTSYSKGINGVMVDINGLVATPTAADFQFRVGNDDAPAGWPAGPAPQSITVRAGAGVGGSDRVTVIWADNDWHTTTPETGAIAGQWLQVTVLATANTGLAAPDVFFFGNAVGESGNSSANAAIDATDEIGARNNPHWFLDPALVDDAYDYNRDKKVDATDQIIARNNQTFFLNDLELITLPVATGSASSATVQVAMRMASLASRIQDTANRQVAVQPTPAAAYDTVLEEGLAAESESPTVASFEPSWVYDFALTLATTQESKRDDSSKKAVDPLLADDLLYPLLP